jgi:hypothetical protein
MTASIFLILWIITLVNYIELRSGIKDRNILEMNDVKYICFEAEVKTEPKAKDAKSKKYFKR